MKTRTRKRCARHKTVK